MRDNMCFGGRIEFVSFSLGNSSLRTARRDEVLEFSFDQFLYLATPIPFPREYVPAYRSGAYAIMRCLYEEAGDETAISKQEVMSAGQKYADASFTIVWVLYGSPLLRVFFF